MSMQRLQRARVFPYGKSSFASLQVERYYRVESISVVHLNLLIITMPLTILSTFLQSQTITHQSESCHLDERQSSLAPSKQTRRRVSRWLDPDRGRLQITEKVCHLLRKARQGQGAWSRVLRGVSNVRSTSDVNFENCLKLTRRSKGAHLKLCCHIRPVLKKKPGDNHTLH